MAAINFNNSFRRVKELISPYFYVYVRRAFGGKTYFEGYLQDIPENADYLDLIVIEISGGAEEYKGQTTRLSKGHPIEYLDITLGDLIVNDCIG